MSDHPFPNAVARFPTLRQSLLSSFDSCALQTKFDMDYRKGWSSHPQGRGTLLHRVLAKCLEEMHRLGEPQIEMDAALGILHEVLRQHDVDDVCHQPGCDLPAHFIPEAERGEDGRCLICPDGHRHHSGVVNVPMAEVKDLYWTVRKWARDNTFDITHLVDVERRLGATVSYPRPEGGHVERMLTGQLDALFLDPRESGHAIVLDHKDTFALPPQTEVSFAGYFQQRFYALLVMRNFPTIQKVTLREFYVRFSQTREVQITRDWLGEIEAECSALAERFDRAFETNSFQPTPGKQCGWCPRPTKCPIPTFVRGEGRITDAEQAERTAAQLLTADVVVKQATKALKAYVEVNGPVEVKNAKGRSFYGFEPVERTTKPTPEQAAQAQKTGVPVSTLYKRSTGTRFGLYTRKPLAAEQEDADMQAEMKRWLEERKAS